MMAEQRPREKLISILPSLKECTYTSQYCEENMWHLCDHVRQHHHDQLVHCYVAFISNKNRTVPLWRQRSGHSEEKLVVWDYHVVFVYHPDDRCLVYDMDTDLPFPTHFHKYVTETFRTDHILHPEHHRLFRIVPAVQYLETFASDRSHMKRGDGDWMSAPPPHPPITSPESTNNLQNFISMDPRFGKGDVLSLSDFVLRFYKNSVNI